MSKIDCYILAAGESSRMFPMNQIMEKSLLPVNGKPVVRHIIENLTQPEVAKHLRNITICCLTKFKKQFEHEFRDMPSIQFQEFDEPVGTFFTWLDTAAVHYGKNITTEWSMVHYADCLTDIDYSDFISDIDPNYHGLIAVTKNVKHDYSEVKLSNNVINTTTARVTEFREKPQLTNYTWSGIGLFNTKQVEDYLDYIDLGEGRKYDFAFDVFPLMIKEKKLKAYLYTGDWYDMGNLNSYRKVCEMFNNNNGA